VIATAIVVAILAIGGRPDPAELRASAPLLDGQWRFRLGDDPRWVGANLDDTTWEELDLTAPATSIDGDVGLPNYVAGWMAHGHADYKGYACYRRKVLVPEGKRTWDILGPPAVDHGYELYWNGQKLGGLGRLNTSPRVVGIRPTIFTLPAGAEGKEGVLAIRVYMEPGYGAGRDSGGIHVAPTLAPRPESVALYHVQWWRTIAGYIVEVVEPIAIAAVIGLALILRRSSERDFITFACLALAFWSAKRLDNAIVAWTDLLSLPMYSWLTRTVWTPLSLAAWALAWNRWSSRSSRAIDAVAVGLAIVGALGGALRILMMTQISRFGFLALLMIAIGRILRGGSMRTMALITMVLVIVAHFAGDLRAIGVPDIWFPFGIGVTLAQYTYGAVIPLLALMIVRTATMDERDPQNEFRNAEAKPL
jgi:hypothetical protein